MVNIFETPQLLLYIAMIVFATLTLIRQTRIKITRWMQLLIPLTIVAVAFGANYLIKADDEKIEILIELTRNAVIKRDIIQIKTAISPDYEDLIHDSSGELLAYCRAMLAEPLIEKAKRKYTRKQISPPNATVELGVLLRFNPQSDYAVIGPMYIETKLHLSKTSEKNWLITSSEIIAINKQPQNWKNIR